MEIIGWIGNLLLCFCGIPQAWLCYKTGKSRGISPSFLWMWGLGEVFALIYAIPTGAVPIIFNLFFSLFIVTIITKYYYWPRKK